MKALHLAIAELVEFLHDSIKAHTVWWAFGLVLAVPAIVILVLS